MFHLYKLVAVGILLMAGAVPQAAAFDAADYHATQCMRCHDTSVYTREDRRITSLPALQTQVERCDAHLATKLFPEDIAALVDHLNDNYYKFDK